MPQLEPNDFSKSEIKPSKTSPFKSSLLSEERDPRIEKIKYISKYIRNNDVSTLVGSSSLYQSAIPEMDEKAFFDENKEVHENLTQLRKKYDEIRGLSLRREQEIQKIRNEIEDTKALEEMVKGNKHQINQKLDHL